MAISGKASPRFRRNLQVVRVILLLLASEALLAFLVQFRSPSMARRAVLLGFSLPRLAAQAGLLLPTLFLAIAATRSFLDESWLARRIVALNAWGSQNPVRLLDLLGSLVTTSLLTAYYLATLRLSLAPHVSGLVKATATHFSEALLFLSLAPLEACLLVVFACQPLLPLAISRAREALFQVLMWPAILLGGLQCITLMLRSDLLFGIGGWFWRATPTPVSPDNLMFFPLWILAAAGFRRVSSPGGPAGYKLVVSVALFYFLQLVFGIAAGRGFESLRTKFTATPLSAELRTACAYSRGAREAIIHYEDDFSHDFWLETKPPGLVAFYIAFRDMTQSLSVRPFSDRDQCTEAVSHVMAFVFPLLASATLLPLFALDKHLDPARNTHDSGLLYMTAPAILLFPLFRDQAIYPLVAAITLAIAVSAALRRSLPLAALGGFVLYCSIFLSFSLLPLVAIVFTFPVLRALGRDHNSSPRSTIAFIIALTAGITIAWLVGRTVLFYDPVARYRAAMEAHRAHKHFVSSAANLARYSFRNLVELVMAGGAPLILLYVVSSIAAVNRSLKGIASALDAFTVAFLLSIVMTFLGGQTTGEVARLWLFMFVPISVVAAMCGQNLNRATSGRLLTILGLQLLVTYVTFMNMDFR